MSIRDVFKQMEEDRSSAAKGNADFPDGVTRYVRMGSHGEVNKEGKTFILLANPDDWYYFFVHEHKTFDGKRTTHLFRKHTCLHSPREIRADVASYLKPSKGKCLSCAALAKRNMYAMIPVYDPEYKTFRIIDTGKYHAENLLADYDKVEKTGRKFNPEYSLIGEAVHIKMVDKSYSLEAGDASDEELAAAKEFIGFDFKYAELANFREVDDITKILLEATDEAKLDKSVLGVAATSAPASMPFIDDGKPIDISADDLPF